MLVRFTLAAALLALATACTNPTAPSATPRNAVRGVSGDGVIIGGSGATVIPPTADGVIIGGSG
jgi:hypothetical protein